MQLSDELMGVHVLVNTVICLGSSEMLLLHVHSFLFLMKKRIILDTGMTSKGNVRC